MAHEGVKMFTSAQGLADLKQGLGSMQGKTFDSTTGSTTTSSTV